MNSRLSYPEPSTQPPLWFRRKQQRRRIRKRLLRVGACGVLLALGGAFLVFGVSATAATVGGGVLVVALLVAAAAGSL